MSKEKSKESVKDQLQEEILSCGGQHRSKLAGDPTKECDVCECNPDNKKGKNKKTVFDPQPKKDKESSDGGKTLICREEPGKVAACKSRQGLSSRRDSGGSGGSSGNNGNYDCSSGRTQSHRTQSLSAADEDDEDDTFCQNLFNEFKCVRMRREKLILKKEIMNLVYCHKIDNEY